MGSVKLSELFPRIAGLGDVRVIVTNGAAVSEWVGTLSGVSQGAKSWNYNADGKEFHLYSAKAKAVKLFCGEHPRFKRLLGQIDILDDAGETGMMIFLIPDETGTNVAALQQLISDLGEQADIEEETPPAQAAGGH